MYLLSFLEFYLIWAPLLTFVIKPFSFFVIFLIKAEVEKAIEELGSVLQNITVATNELKKLEGRAQLLTWWKVRPGVHC